MLLSSLLFIPVLGIFLIHIYLSKPIFKDKLIFSFLYHIFVIWLFAFCYLFYFANPILFDSGDEGGSDDGVENENGNPDFDIGDDPSTLNDQQLQTRLNAFKT